jgi:hypothetical protein
VGGTCSTTGEDDRLYVIGGNCQDVSGWIILRWILERYDGVVLTGLVWLRKETS